MKLNIVGERGSADVQGTTRFSETFEQIVTKYKLTSDLIYNADETGLYWGVCQEKHWLDMKRNHHAGRHQN